IGAVIATGAAIAMVVFPILWAALEVKEYGGEYQTLWDALDVAWSAVQVTFCVGLAIAAWERRAAAIGTAALAIAVSMPFLVTRHILEALHIGQTGVEVYEISVAAVRTAALAILAGCAAREFAGAQPELAINGFRRAARGLWWQVAVV